MRTATEQKTILSGLQMKNKLQELLDAKSQKHFATTSGADMHKRLEHVFFRFDGPVGDKELCDKISKNSELVKLMGPLSKTEVPIAGFVNGIFVSRRIDRLYIDKDNKQIVVLDYKTDTSKDVFRDKYIIQLKEYRDLLTQVFPGFTISCKILWLCDFTLENII